MLTLWIRSVGPRSIIGPKGFCRSEENSYLFSGSWGSLIIIFRDLGSKFIVLGIEGALQKSFKKSHLIGKAFISLDFFKKNLRPPWKI